MRAKLGISTNCFWPDKRRIDGEMLASIRKAGIKRVELAAEEPDHFDHNDRKHIEEIKRECREQGMQIVSYHAPNLPFDFPTETIRNAVVTDAVAILRAAEELGAAVVVWHGMLLNDTAIRNLHDIFDRLDGSRIRAATENGEKLEDYAAAVDRVGIERFGMIVDIGHTIDDDGINPMTKKERARKTIGICRDRLFHLHLHEFQEGADHWPPFYGESLIQWDELFKGLADIGYDGELMFESVTPRPDDPIAFNENLQRVATFPEEFARKYREN